MLEIGRFGCIIQYRRIISHSTLLCETSVREPVNFCVRTWFVFVLIFNKHAFVQTKSAGHSIINYNIHRVVRDLV